MDFKAGNYKQFIPTCYFSRNYTKSHRRKVHVVILPSQKPEHVFYSCFTHVLFCKNFTRIFQFISFSVTQKCVRSTRTFLATRQSSLYSTSRRKDTPSTKPQPSHFLSCVEELKVFVWFFHINLQLCSLVFVSRTEMTIIMQKSKGWNLRHASAGKSHP